MNGIKVLVALVGAVTVCGGAGAEWPEPPYTEENIKGFVNNEDLRNASQLFIFSEDSPIQIDPFSVSGLLVGERTFKKDLGLDKGLEFEFTELTQRSSTETREIDAKFGGLYSNLLWDRNGGLVGLNIRYYEQEDISKINDFDELRYINIAEPTDSNAVVNFEGLSSKLPLKMVKLSNVQAEGVSRFCDYESVVQIEVVDSRILDSLSFDGCGGLKNVFFVDSFGQRLEVANLLELSHLGVFGGKIKDLIIDGSSLPNLKTLNITSTDLPSDLSQVRLPNGLVQIYLKYAKDNALAELSIPDSVEFIDLKSAELNDYSFLSTAKGLKHLRLRGSSFDQWELLSELDQLEYLDLVDTNIEDKDVQYLVPLINLKYLSLASTNVSDVSQLKSLQNLYFFNLYETDVLDFNNIPFIQNISNLGLARLEHYEMSEQFPAHIVEMMKTVNYEEGCNGLKPCGTPAWSIGTR